MKALSIQQPWAYCITNGTKRVENRTWATPFRGRFLIHAGKKRQIGVEHEIHLDSPEMVIDEMQRSPIGAIVGVASLIGCVGPGSVPRGQRIWAGGPWCFVLDDVRAFALPIPYKGSLGFFDVPDAIVAEAMR